jgi:hypothetical protein
MWGFLRKRKEGDLERLVSAFRSYLKVAERGDFATGGDEPDRTWKGGFGRAFNLLFNEWPTPNQSRQFQKLINRRLSKTPNTDEAFIRAFNDFLGQKALNEGELLEVIQVGVVSRKR